MSGGYACRCAEKRKPIKSRHWLVIQRYCNHSAFNGYHETYSDYSTIQCTECHACWRTRAPYVGYLKDATNDQIRTGKWLAGKVTAKE